VREAFMGQVGFERSREGESPRPEHYKVVKIGTTYRGQGAHQTEMREMVTMERPLATSGLTGINGKANCVNKLGP
jgi:hypothetical protein